MKKIFASTIILTLVFCSCHKDKKPLPDKPEPPTEDTVKQFSYWIVNEDSFSTNEVAVTIGHEITRIMSNSGPNNYFRMQFNLSYLPTSGTFHLTTHETSDPTNAEISFYYNRTFYVISPAENSALVASLINNKPQFTLNATWFLNYYDSTDSVSIRGLFREP